MKQHKLDLEHKEKLRVKAERLGALRDILRTHEESGTEPDDSYLSQLRSRIRRTEHQLMSMGGI